MDKVVTVRHTDDSIKLTRLLNKGYHVIDKIMTGQYGFEYEYIVFLRKEEEYKPAEIEEIRIINLKDNPNYNTEMNDLKKIGFKVDKYTTATVTMVKLK